MLNEILDLLKKGKNFSVQELANTLNTSDERVKVQMEYLERQGYIKKVELQMGCSSGCSRCTGCKQGTGMPVMWELI